MFFVLVFLSTGCFEKKISHMVLIKSIVGCSSYDSAIGDYDTLKTTTIRKHP
jgi:hypothetical protein